MHSPPLLQQPAHCAPPWSPSSSSFAPSSTEDGIDDADDDELTGSVVADPSYADDDDDDDDGDDDEQDGDLHPALDELPQDSKDVLVERLTDLAQRLSATGRGPGRGALQPGDISALHARVDDIEDSDDPRDARTRGGGGVSAATVATEVASQIRVEADKLDRELMAVLSSLQARREEADHLHDMLLDRANGAAKRILALEQEIAELKEEIAGNEADLRNLGLQLKAIEAVCDTPIDEVTTGWNMST
ncbi:hypothetical protein P8C59_007256 [Phyllachora maydis]|uniref:Uncharacterized protein n=1 Tax=Phyllachora maydis TaxID=1825666 RepID=A0AAD9I9S9_9PEZI|nr:hypothetical protein P8C59_007256 [Phyllachora maydis]